MVVIPIPLEITTPKKRYPPVGRCIYCLAYSGKLQDEHVVPYGLAGNLIVLPKASCSSCASITGKIEYYCLREILGHFRIKIGAPTRRPRERPDNIEVHRGRYDRTRSAVELSQIVTIAPSDLPFMYPSLTFPTAGILVGRSPDEDVNYELKIHRMEGELEGFLGKDGAIRIGPMLPIEYVRMIAKIAHAYAIAELGLNGFRPLLKQLILDKTITLTRALHLVGSEIPTPASTPDFLFVAWDRCVLADGRRYVVVRLRLFPCFGAPLYHVFVGEFDDS
jgi:hypothetical protein